MRTRIRASGEAHDGSAESTALPLNACALVRNAVQDPTQDGTQDPSQDALQNITEVEGDD